MTKYSYRFDGTSFTGEKYTYRGPSTNPCSRVLGPTPTEMGGAIGWSLSGSSYIYGNTKGLICNIYSGVSNNVRIDSILIPVLGNSSEFADMNPSNRGEFTTCGNQTSAFIIGGETLNSPHTYILSIESIDFSSSGSMTNHGSLTNGLYCVGPSSNNNIRGIVYLSEIGSAPSNKVIHLLNLITKSNSENIGNIDIHWVFMPSGCGSSLIGIYSGVMRTEEPQISSIFSVSFSNLGESTRFGDLIYENYYQVSSCSSSTRFLNIGGRASNVNISTISYGMISSSGSMQNFGNLSEPKMVTSTCSTTRSISGTSLDADGYGSKLIEYVEIASLGDSSNFGDLSNPIGSWGVDTSTSNCHGGLS